MTNSITEAQLQNWLRDLAGVLKWAYHHPWTSVHSSSGLPDTLLVRPPRVLYVECKRENTKLSPAQIGWMELLKQCPGVETFVLRPSNRDELERMMT